MDHGMLQKQVFYTQKERAAAINKQQDGAWRQKRQKKQQQRRNTAQQEEDSVVRRLQRAENGLRSLETQVETTRAQLAASKAVTDKLTAKLAAREVTADAVTGSRMGFIYSVTDEQSAEDEFEVDKVLGMDEDGKFKVLWKIVPGQTEADVTWEPAKNLLNAAEKVRIYLDAALSPLDMFSVSKKIVNLMRISPTMSFVNGRRTAHAPHPFVKVIGRAPHKMIMTQADIDRRRALGEFKDGSYTGTGIQAAQTASGGQQMVRREFKDGKYRRAGQQGDDSEDD